MNSQAPDLLDVVARLDKLERQNRWLKRALGLLVVVGAAFLLVSPNQPGQAEQAKGGKDSMLAARSITLLDENGDRVGGLSASKGNASLGVGNFRNGPTGSLKATANESVLVLRDPKTKAAVRLEVGPNGPLFEMKDKDGKVVFSKP